MKKTLFFALGAALLMGMASCSKENVNPTNGMDLTANALMANQSDNFAGTEWICNVDTVIDLSDFFQNGGFFAMKRAKCDGCCDSNGWGGWGFGDDWGDGWGDWGFGDDWGDWGFGDGDMNWPVNATFRLSFNETGDTVLMSITADSSDIIFITGGGESTTIAFAFNYDIDANEGTMVGVFNDVMGEPVDIVLNFTYNVTNNTMLVTMPFDLENEDAMSAGFLSIFKHLLFTLV